MKKKKKKPIEYTTVLCDNILLLCIHYGVHSSLIVSGRCTDIHAQIPYSFAILFCPILI